MGTKSLIYHILTQDHYLPGTVKDFIKFSENYLKPTEYFLKKDKQEDFWGIYHQNSNLVLFQLMIRDHNKNLFLLQAHDTLGSVKAMTELKNKPFLIKIINSTKVMYSLMNSWKAYNALNTNEINLDLQESGYQLTDEEATTIGTILSKMAALKGHNYKQLKNINFKLSFNAIKKENNNNDQ